MRYDMTRQEIFDTVALALIKQGEPAFIEDKCQYLTEDGKRCAVGWLLNGEMLEFSKTMIHGVDELIKQAEFKQIDMPSFLVTEQRFLRAIQGAHDIPARAACVAGDMQIWQTIWAKRMYEIATHFELSTAVLKGVQDNELGNLPATQETNSPSGSESQTP